MFGVSIIVIVLLVSLIVTLKHGRFNFGQILFGIWLGLLVTGIFPTLAPAVRESANSISNALMNFNFNG